MPLGEPSRVGYPGLSFLDPPVSGVAQPAFEASRSERRIGEEIRDIGVKRALVLVQREKVISALVDDFLGDSLLRPDRVDGDDGALDRNPQIAASKARATGTGDPTLADAGRPGRDQHRRRTTRQGTSA